MKFAKKRSPLNQFPLHHVEPKIGQVGFIALKLPLEVDAFVSQCPGKDLVFTKRENVPSKCCQVLRDSGIVKIALLFKFSYYLKKKVFAATSVQC